MISSTYKLKASKSSRDFPDYQGDQSEENYDAESLDGDATGDSNRRFNFYNSRDGRYRGIRSRQTEYKSNRGNDRRNSYRGRGASQRRNEREFAEGNAYVLNRKYQDSLNRNAEGAFNYQSKYFEADKKSELKFNLPEDTRISKLLRRLSNETDQDNSLLISKKLLEVLMLPDNAQYVRRSFHILSESMLNIFQTAPGITAKKQSARCLGRMGYILGQENDFDRFQNWLFAKMSSASEDLQHLFMQALKEVVCLELQKPVLQKHTLTLMRNLVLFIEVTDNVEVFKGALENLMTVVEIYPEDFYPLFRDTIDLLIGWHVDHTQPLSNVEFISKNMQRISKHFQSNMEFSVTMVLHFVEDIETYTVLLLKKDLDTQDGSESSSIEQVTVFILALNTVLKCLAESLKPANNEFVTMKLLTECLNQIVKTATDTLEAFVPDNLTIAANECICILLEVVGSKSIALNSAIFNLIDLELSLTQEFSDATIISMLLMISKVVKEISANLPIEIIPKLVGPQSEIIKYRNSFFCDVQEAVICVYQSLLNLKNIPLLQEAYRYILGDLETVYRLIVPDINSLSLNNPFEAPSCQEHEVEVTVLFLLRCLSQLANASSSIIGMWALKPSVLELLGVLLKPHSAILASQAPTLQYSLLYLLFSHCKCYNYFISSSCLIADNLMGRLTNSKSIDDVSSQSPNSGNLSVILNVIHKTLSSRKGNVETTLFLLNCLNELLIHAYSYLEMLYTAAEFSSVVKALTKIGFNKNTKIALAVCKGLETLLSNKQLCWKNSFLLTVTDLCVLHAKSTDVQVRDSYVRLSINVPWDIVMQEFGKVEKVEKTTNFDFYNNATVASALNAHMNSAFSEMQAFHFKLLMKYLLSNAEKTETPLSIEEIFLASWPTESESQVLSDQFRELSLASRVVLNNWCTWEAAQFCVNNKLRTPLGKPNETFTSFENALKILHKSVVENDTTTPVDTDRVRLLLQFMEHLELLISNAADGCAMAIPQPPKPVRTFFTTNASTCKEWLLRIRMILIQLALHTGQSTIALRHGYALLKDLYTANKCESLSFERAITHVTVALLNLREFEALNGLYLWAKNVAKRNFRFIQIAAEQASHKYELAANHYKEFLKDEEASAVNAFAQEQLLNCYKELHLWFEITLEKPDSCSYNFIDPSYAETVYNLEHNIRAFNDLNSWEASGELLTAGDDPKAWSLYETYRSVERNLYNVAYNVGNVENKVILTKVDSVLATIREQIADSALLLPSEFLHEFCLLHYVAHGLRNVANATSAGAIFLVSEEFETRATRIDSRALSKVLWWSQYFAYVQTQGFGAFCNTLRLNIIKKGRKERNFDLASNHLLAFLEEKELRECLATATTRSFLTVKALAGSFIAQVPEISAWTVDIAKAISEMIKLLYDDAESRQLTFNLCAVTSTSISKHAEMFGGKELREISSRILLKLAKWLPANEQVSLTEMNSPLGKFLMVLPEIGMIDNTTSVIPLSEMAIGKLLQFSVHQCAGLSKAWYEFGTWCYRWGRKVIGKSSDVSVTLTDEDRAAIKTLVPADVTLDDLGKIFAILSQTRTIVDDEDIEANEINTSEMILSQLSDLPVLQGVQLHSLVQIWRRIQKRIYIYYELSAGAYFKYLHLATATSADYTSKSADSNSITVTLRLLRLIVKHALELQNVLEDGLASTPTQPWKVIIPQLFSRLNHPEVYVRQRVSELLRRIAEDAPHLITFPAVVGALEGGVKFDFSEISLPKDSLSQSHEPGEEELNEIEDVFEDVDDTNKNDLQACFKSMVDTLSKQAPETINQVQVFVKELRRIILLWDELWLGTLAQHHGEISKRQAQLELEIEKVAENTSLTDEQRASLIAEKFRIVIKPIVYVIEQLHDITSAEAETPHEKKFQERYSEAILDVLNKLKNPQNPEKPEESWQLIKNLQSKFQQKASKGAYTLKMAEISPVLAGLKDTVIAMPGSSSTKVTIAHVSNHVAILPTKTKPKKLVFHGSDGQSYTYLFKGLEDLHLDERIMQFLSIANTMMAHSNTNTNLYRARHYSVIPLGPRSGLISWVDGTTPVFALYKRWQQREAAKLNKSSTVMRPSELFYHKLNPLLQEHGVKNPENRKEWPFAVLKQVLGELMAETPSDLITKELWCRSVNAGVWWQMTRRYSYSVAVMSVIGYVIGLGDRHLDNVLIDLNSGEVVHIDYNVCFEKGKTLRVPEKVPFRLTPNFVDALGVTGTEGIFRLTCENVLKTMKKGRETLLTLLEAFVYDPLVDWTVGGGSLAGTTYGGVVGNMVQRQTHKDLERDVTLSMYNVRCTELKFEWEENRQEILENLPKLKEALLKWLEEDGKLMKTEDWLQDLHQQMALVKEAEANGISKHPIYSLPGRYEANKKKLDAMGVAKGDLNGLAVECDTHLQKYSDALKVLESPKFGEWYAELNINYDQDATHVFDLVKEFLQNAGKVNMVDQCEQSENDVGKLAHKQTLITLKCLHLLRDYVAVLSQCSPAFIERHRMYLFLKWSKYLQEFKSLDACDVVYQQMYALLEIKNSQLAKAILQFSYNVNLLYAEAVKNVKQTYEDLSKARGEEGALEKTYGDAKLSITNFLRLEKDGTNAFEFVIISELLILNQSFLSLETVASRSGDYLLTLTFRDGDWFLDELTLFSDRSLELLSYLPLHTNSKIEDARFLQVINGLHAANNVYKSLQELNFNFHTIILPETMKKIQSDEITVIQMIQDINNVILNVGMPLAELIAHLEKHLTNTILQRVKNPLPDCIMKLLTTVKLRYQSLLQTNDQKLSPGKMLLMGFNGLFDKLDAEFNALISILSSLEVPNSWRKIDQAKDAKELTAPVFNTQVKAILTDIFFLKRLQAMSEFFSLCLEMCQSFRGIDNLCVLNDEQLNKPIRKYTADFISRQFLGITTETIAFTMCFLLQHLGLDVTREIEQKDIGAESKVPLDELYQKSWNGFLKNGTFTPNVLAQASSLETNLKTAWEKLQDPKKLEQNLALQQSTVVRLQNQMTLHNWIYETILQQNVILQSHCSFTRTKFVQDLRAEVGNLLTVQEQLREAREEQKNLIASVEQRLKWAAGANPDVNEVLSAFELAVAERDKKLELDQQIVAVITSTCQIVAHHELLRSHSSAETKTYDQRFLNYLEKFRAACQYHSNMDPITHLEENIMRWCTSDLFANPKWVSVISEKLSEVITSHQKQLTEKKCDVLLASHGIGACLEALKSSYAKHGALMADFKPLLKSMTKIDEYAQQTLHFVGLYRRFAESFSGLTLKFVEMSKREVDGAMGSVAYLEGSIDAVYEGLMDLKSVRVGQDGGLAEDGAAIRLVKQESVSKGQQKNAYAVGVWRRVRMKLEGRDPDPGRKYLTQEQVDYVIREATSLDNLALLYEGWTPWV